MDLKHNIEELITSKGLRKNFRKLLPNYPDLLSQIEIFKINGFTNIIQILYHIYYDINEIPLCEVCKVNNIRFLGWSLGYHATHCSSVCGRRNPKTQEKLNASIFQKYGVINPFLKNGVREKALATKSTVEYHERISMILNDPDVRAKAAESTKKTLLKKYGVEFIGQVEEFKEKRLNVQKTNRQSGVYNERKKLKRSKEIKQIFANKVLKFESTMNVKVLDDSSSYSDIGSLISMQCNSCHSVFKSTFHNKNYMACPKCVPHNRSKLENEVFQYCLSACNDALINSHQSYRKLIKNKEVDMYFPDYNLAIEVNGLYWHSERFIDKNYHKEKTNLVTETGTRLMQIFSDEWFYKQDIVKSMLSSAFGKTKKIFARKCTLKDITYSDAKTFLTENHIQGSAISSYNLGLFYDEVLVAVMTFAKPRFNKKYDWELMRFANLKNHTVVGGAGKLFAHFKKYKLGAGSIISYCDLRLGTGKMYNKIGMTQIGVTEPNYFYLDPSYSVRHNRMKFQKHKLQQIMGDSFDPNKTEIENMKNYGYFRTWDCGNLIFEYRK